MQKDHLEILLEDIRSKFDLVLEGNAALDRKMDTRFDELSHRIEHNTFMIDALNKKIDTVDQRLSQKIDALAADVKAHRADTEAHRKGWRVSEGE